MTHVPDEVSFPIPINMFISSIHYTMTPCSRVLLEKLTVTQLVKKFPAFYGTRGFITVFTTVRNWSLSRDHSLKIYSNVIYSSTPRSSEWPLLFTFSDQNFVCISHPSLDQFGG
jgi:hypothetical protein